MSLTNNEDRSVVLWYMNGCIATFYQSDQEQQRKKVPVDTISFTNKAYLAFRKVNLLRIASPAVPYLRNLSSVQLQNNNLTSLPSELWKLVNLTELNLGCNQLQELPIEIGLLINLRELFLHSNKITNIPSQIGNLVHLTTLDLTENQLNNLPGELLRLNLKNLWIDHNSFDENNKEEEEEEEESFISLKSICLQIIGLTCLQDEESRKVIQEVQHHGHDLIPNCTTLDIIPKCYNCSCYLFHPGLEIVKKDDKIPLLFKACSQNCYIAISSKLNYFV